ncbi:MAG TPA: type II secretion system F family protein [Polyangia bacterium]
MGGALAGLHWELGIAAGAGMLFVVAVAAGLRSLLGRRDEIVDRIERTVAASSTTSMRPAVDADSERTSTSVTWARVFRPFAWLARPAQADELARLRTSLIRAGYRGEHAMEIFLGLKLTMAPVATITFLLINSQFVNPLAFPLDLGIALVIAALFFFVPNLYLRSQTSNRQKAIEQALPDAMDLLVTCVEAGLGLDATIVRVADEMVIAAPLLAEELQHTALEIQAGVARADGFRRLAERTGVEDLRALSAMLIQTDMFGTSIAKALRVHGESMRVRRSQRAEEKAAMVSVKMTIPLIMCILPSLLAIVMGPAVAMIVKNFAGE